MPTLSQQKPSVTTTASSAYFNNYSGKYTFNLSELLKNNGVTKISQITKIDFILNTHYLRGSSLSNSQINDNYAIRYYNTSTPTNETAITNYLNFSRTSSQQQLSGTTFTVDASQLSAVANTLLTGNLVVSIAKKTSGGQAYFYYGPSSASSLNNSNKGLMTCSVTYTESSSLGAPSITSLSPTAGTTSYTISWNSVAGATSYKVKYRLSGSSSWSSTGNIYSPTYSGSVSSFGTWQFQIEASNGTNTTTSAIVSASFSAVSVLQPPTELSVTPTSAGSLSYTFSWNEATGGTGPYYYSPYCDGIQLTGYDDSTSYSGTVTSYGKHIFKVKVYDVGGGIIKPSNEYTYNFKQAAQQLQAPTITSITQTPANSLNYTVTWSAATGGTGSKKYLLICDNSGIGGLISGLQASGSVSTYGEHTFKVLVIDDVGTTAYSREVKHVFTTAPVVAELQAPTGLEVIRNSDNSLRYTFQWEPAEGGSGIKYYTPRCDNENIKTKITGTSCSGEVSSYDWHMFDVIVEDDNESKMSDPIYVDFREVTVPTLNPPSNLKIKHIDGSSQFTLTWNAAQASGGSGTVTYNIEKLVNGKWEYLDFGNGLNLTGTKYSGTIPGWGEQTLAVCAMYDDLIERASITYNFKYVAATKIAPEIIDIDYSPGDTQFYITWSAAYDSSFSGIFYYNVRNVSTNTKIVTNSTDTGAWVDVPGYDIKYQFDVYANYTLGSISSKKTFEYTFDSIPPITLEAPGAPTITQSPTQATFSASWTRAVASDGGTNISYSVYCGDSKIGESTVGLSLTNLSIPNYNISNNFYIKANYAGISANSSSVKATFSPPSMTAPTITVTPTEGSSVTVSWTKPKLSYTTGDITYKLYCKKNSTASSSSWITFGDVGTLLEQNIQEEWLKIKGVEGDIFYFQVDATATNLSHIANNTTTLMRGSDFAPGFTFKIGGSVGYYYNNAWQECTVYYYNGSKWVECIPYYYNGGWQEINTKIE